MEVAARHLRVHRVRALHELLPRVQHRQEPVADAAHPRHPLRDARSRHATIASPSRTCSRIDTLPARRDARAGRTQARRGEASQQPLIGGRTTEGRAVGVHDLRRLPGGLPGLHRAPAEDPPDAPEPGARAGEGAARAGAHVPQPRAQQQPVGHRRRQAHGLGEGLDVPTIEDKPEPRVPPVGRLRRRVRRPHHQADARAGRGARDGAASTSRCSVTRKACTGDPARRAGNEMLFQMQAEQNVETMNDARR